MTSPDRGPTDTRERLILAAERLFAERGIWSVSLREIGAAAGQRNTSAAQYHFGSKEALVVAIFEYRMAAINDRRLQMLAEMQAQGRAEQLRSLLEAFVYPLAHSVTKPESHYGRFLSQLTVDPNLSTSYEWDTASSLRLVWTGVARCLAELPKPVLRARMRMLTHLVLHTMGDHARADDVPEGAGAAPWTVDLVDAAVGLLTAPVSTAPGESGNEPGPVGPATSGEGPRSRRPQRAEGPGLTRTPFRKGTPS